MKLLLTCLTFCFFAHTQIIASSPLVGIEKFRFYSPNATEAVLTFNFTVELPSRTQPRDTEVLTAIDKQVSFLFGAF